MTTDRLREAVEAAIERLNGLVVISQDGSGYDTQWDYDTAQIASELHAALREHQERAPLTDETIRELFLVVGNTPKDFARAIERAHGIGKESSDDA